jgi:thioredoxin-related protein
LSRSISIAAVLLTLLVLSWRAGAAVQVPVTNDLQADGALAGQRHLPILLVFTASDCSYCDLLESDILKPMLISGDYTNKVIIRKVVIDKQGGLRDFDGKPTTAHALADRYGVYVTPTLLFLGPHGRELTHRMVGINTVDMYGGLVDAAIAASLKRLHRHPGSSSAKTLARSIDTARR